MYYRVTAPVTFLVNAENAEAAITEVIESTTTSIAEYPSSDIHHISVDRAALTAEKVGPTNLDTFRDAT